MYKRCPKAPFSEFLGQWRKWLEYIKHYRDQCTHHRTLSMEGGRKSVEEDGVKASAAVPFVVPDTLGPDRPDHCESSCGPSSKLPEGLVLEISRSETGTARGDMKLTGLEVNYLPAAGYVRVENFCARNFEKLKGLVVGGLAAMLGTGFVLQPPPCKSLAKK